MLTTDILIIGGGPAGIVAAVTARKNNPKKKIILVREQDKCVVPCGLPYIFYRLNSVEKDLMPDKPYQMNKIDLVIDKVIKIGAVQKKVFLQNNQKIKYNKLILATGASPALIPIKGADLAGVWQIKKDLAYLKKLRQAILKAKNIVIIGGGFIGVELAEEISSIKGKNISIIEILDHCLELAFDKEFAQAGEEKIRAKGVKIYTKTAVEKINGKDTLAGSVQGKVKYVKLSNGQKILADLVIMATGVKPNVELAKQAGIKVVDRGGISVDQYMRTSPPLLKLRSHAAIALSDGARTSNQDIFAIGDCAQTKCFCTKKSNLIMLASVACYEARIAGANLYRKNNLIKNQGAVAAFSTYLDGLAIASVGLTENAAKKEKIDVIIGRSEAANHHPAILPNSQKITVKLIFKKSSKPSQSSRLGGRDCDGAEKVLVGGQVMGPESAGEIINIISLAVQQKMTAQELVNLQVATHPLLTAAPTVYPIITAASAVL
ncbi:FAD-dependent oxidoreductase [Candidatus Parcubacteria bacterium]|nr:FAD-dependent oxidoreductase [Candidatus Parcubacteria bacterium]